MEQRSPQAQLPPEVFSRIFVLAFGDTELIEFPVKASQLPWIVTRVCSRWRSIARAEPLLWKRVFVYATTKRFKSAISFLRVTLPQSGPLHLDLSTETLHESRIRALLLPYIHRTEVLGLGVMDSMCEVIAKFPPRSFDKITNISLSLLGSGRKDIIAPLSGYWLLFSRLPKRLRGLTLAVHESKPEERHDGVDFVLRAESSLLCCLVHLDLSQFSVQVKVGDMIQFLRQCVALESLNLPRLLLSDPSPSINSSKSTPTVDFMPCLTSLKLYRRVALDIPITWRRITTLMIRLEPLSSEVICSVLDALSTMENIEELSTDFRNHIKLLAGNSGSAPVAHSPIILKKLAVLTINVLDRWLIPYLVIPEVTEIRITCANVAPYIPGGDLLDLVSRSECTTKVQVLECSAIPRDIDVQQYCAFNRLISDLRSLRELSVPWVRLSREMLRNIASGGLLPRLEILSIDIAVPGDFVDVVQCRVEQTCGVLRVATGFYTKEEVPQVLLTEATEELHRINLAIGSDFRLLKQRYTPFNWSTVDFL